MSIAACHRDRADFWNPTGALVASKSRARSAAPMPPLPPLRPYSLTPGQLIEVEAVQPETKTHTRVVIRACRRAGVTLRRAGDRPPGGC
jgi:hypothetical protein